MDSPASTIARCDVGFRAAPTRGIRCVTVRSSPGRAWQRRPDAAMKSRSGLERLCRLWISVKHRGRVPHCRLSDGTKIRKRSRLSDARLELKKTSSERSRKENVTWRPNFFALQTQRSSTCSTPQAHSNVCTESAGKFSSSIFLPSTSCTRFSPPVLASTATKLPFGFRNPT